MKYLITLGACLISILLSCKKTTLINTIDPPTSGNMIYRIVDHSGKGVPGIKVSINSLKGSSIRSYVFLNSAVTNADGTVHFQELKPDSYLVMADSAVVDQISYKTHSYVQVIAGMQKEKVISTSDFSGKLNFNLTSGSPISDFSLVAVPFSVKNLSTETLKKAIDEALIRVKPDQNMFASLTIPSETKYYIIAYNPDKSKIVKWDSFFIVNPQESYSTTLHVVFWD